MEIEKFWSATITRTDNDMWTVSITTIDGEDETHVRKLYAFTDFEALILAIQQVVDNGVEVAE